MSYTLAARAKASTLVSTEIWPKSSSFAMKRTGRENSPKLGLRGVNSQWLRGPATTYTELDSFGVRALVSDGKSLMITAEGIETSQQLERVREMGCDEAQGFLLSTPVNAYKVADQLGRLGPNAIRTSPFRLVASICSLSQRSLRDF